MRLIPVEKAPDWLKLDQDSGIYYIKIYRAHCRPRGLCRSTKETQKGRAISVGERIIARWLGPNPLTGERPRIRFSECAREFIEGMKDRLGRGKIREGTLMNAVRYAKDLTEEFGHMTVDAIRPQDWALYCAKYRRLKPGQTLYSQWKHMSMIMLHAYKNDYRTLRWFVENPDPAPREQRKLTDQEVQDLLRVSVGGDIHDQILAASTMGMRLREILRQSFKPGACCYSDMQDRTISICRNHSKTRTPRRMVMTAQVYAAWLRRYDQRERSFEFVFPNPLDPSRPMHQNKTAWRTAKKQAKIQGACKFHLLRHYFLSSCAKKVREGKVGIAGVCKYAGLTIRVFEMRYLHMDHHDTAGVADMVRLDFGENSSLGEVLN